MTRLARRFRCREALAGLALSGSLAALTALAPAATAASAPAWTIRSLPAPAHFTPGDEAGRYQYEVRAANSGGAPTDGSPIVLTDVVPAGLTVKDVELPLRGPESAWDAFSELCEVEASGAVETVTCTVPEEVPEAVEPTVLAPAEQIRMIVLVSTPAGAEGTSLTNVAEVKGGGAGSVSTTSQNEASSGTAAPGFTDFGAALLGVDGQSNRGAGSIPYQYVTSFAVNTAARFPSSPSSSPDSRLFDPAGGDVKDVRVALPPGLVGDPTVASRCTPQQFNTSHAVEPVPGSVVVQNDCPDGSAVGLVVVEQLEGRGGTIPVPLYNLVPPNGMPAQLGFQILGAPFYVNTELRTGGDYGITAFVRNTTEIERVSAATVIVWGVPGDPSHDAVRGHCLNPNVESRFYSLGSCAPGVSVKRFLRSPTSCELPLLTQMSFDTWTNPGLFATAGSSEPALVNCAALDFNPTISAVPHTTVADSPSGLRFNLHLPQSDDPSLLAQADLRDAVVTLPEGVTVNPASAGGLAVCSPAQIDLHGSQPANCPDASKVGTVEVDTPLLDHPVGGAVYLAAQNDNPFDSLLAIYIALHDPQSGIVVKLAGHVVPDPVTGQLTTRFADNPQLPFEDFTVEFFDGPRAPLRTPATCGAYTTRTELTPWSAPESGPAAPSDSFVVSAAPGGGPCAASEAAQPHRPGFSAGTLAPVAASYSTLVTNLRREDGSQVLRGLNVALPQGLVGKLAGVPYCPEPAIAMAGASTGTAEQAHSSCPAASQVGTVDVGAGAGTSPVNVQGRVYLAGPYKGAPLSLAVVTPAVAGPFDLGTVVVRAALHVDPRTAQVTVFSDPLPTILQGIPLDVRSIHVAADRSSFTRNPTSCEPMAVGGEALSLAGRVAPLLSPFRVGGCRGLDFAPRLGLRLKGGARRAENPKLIATLTAREGEADIARAAVKLPRSSFLDQSHIRTVCTRVQFAADACPKGSIYGRATAITPLLDYPLAGPVYLRSSDNPLPDLVVDLRGPAHQPIRIELAGRTDSVKGALRNTFDFVPDAPVSMFRLELFGGKRGLVVNSRNLCLGPAFATARFRGHNGKAASLRPRVRNDCSHRKRAGKHRG